MTMDELASGMIAEAKDDLESAEIMFSSRKYAKTIWNCKQFMEKTLKAVLYLEGHGTIIDHEVAGMFANEMMGKVKDDATIAKMKDISTIGFETERFGNVRYPIQRRGMIFVPSRDVKQEDAEMVLGECKRAHGLLKEMFLNLYGIDMDKV